MSISMNADFKILNDVGNGQYFPLDKEDAIGMTIGAFSFVIDGKAVMFDWDACSGSERDKVFSFETGSGPFFNDYELADYYDKDLAEIGLSREDLTADFLAGAEFIEEFHVNYDDQEGHEVSLGWHEDNAGAPDLKVKLLSVGFEDMESGRVYFVRPDVLESFNKGILREKALEVKEEDMRNMADRATLRMKQETRLAMRDLDSQISFANDSLIKGEKSAFSGARDRGPGARD